MQHTESKIFRAVGQEEKQFWSTKNDFILQKIPTANEKVFISTKTITTKVGSR